MRIYNNYFWPVLIIYRDYSMKTVFYVFLIFFSHQVMGQFTAREYFKFGKSKYDDGKYYETISFLDKAIKLDSSYQNAYFLRAEAFSAVGSYKLAIYDYTKIINSRTVDDSYAVEYFLGRAVARMEVEKYKGAASDINKVFELKPIFPMALYERARLKFLTLNNKMEAIRDLNRAIIQDPEEALFYVRRAEYYAHFAKFGVNSDKYLKSATIDMTKAISLDPENFEYYLIRSQYNKDRGAPNAAIADYNVMIKIHPGRVEAYTERGMIEMQNDQYNSAISDFTKSIELQPSVEHNYRYRALCRHNLLDFGGAYNDYTKSIDLLNTQLRNSPDDESLKRILADTYIKRGAAGTSMGNTFNSCADFRMAYELGSSIGLNYLRKYCGI